MIYRQHKKYEQSDWLRGHEYISYSISYFMCKNMTAFLFWGVVSKKRK